MRRLARWLKRLGLALVVLVTGVWVSLAPGDPELYPPDVEGIPVHVVDHGWHTGLVIYQSDIRTAALTASRSDPGAGARLRWLASRYPTAEWIEIGWGDAEFYQATPGVEDVDIWLGAKALFVPTSSVLQIVPGQIRVSDAFRSSDIIELTLGSEGFAALARMLAATIPANPPALADGPSLYG